MPQDIKKSVLVEFHEVCHKAVWEEVCSDFFNFEAEGESFWSQNITGDGT
jgi:hypothetical protein